MMVENNVDLLRLSLQRHSGIKKAFVNGYLSSFSFHSGNQI